MKVSLASAIMCMALLCTSQAYAQTNGGCISPLVPASSIPGSVAGATGCVYPIVTLATLPGLTTANQAIAPATYIQGLYAFAIGIGAVIAVVSGVYAGLEYMLSETSFTTVSEAKKRMWNVLLGAGLLFCSYLLLAVINPQLVNWNFNLGTISGGALKSDIAANNAAQTAQQQTAYVTQAANDVQTAASAQTALTNAQAWLDNLAGDSDPDNQCAGTTYASANPDICQPIAQAQAAVETAQATSIQTTGDSAITTADSNIYAAEQAYETGCGTFSGGGYNQANTACGNAAVVANAVKAADVSAANSITQIQNLLSTSQSQQMTTSLTTQLNQITSEKNNFDSQMKGDATIQQMINNATSAQLDGTVQ